MNEVDDHALGPPGPDHRAGSRTASSPPPSGRDPRSAEWLDYVEAPPRRRPRRRRMPSCVAIYDTTLRDGMQREGLSLSVGEQLAVALRLADFGVDYLEAGFPASNPKYGELFRLLEQRGPRAPPASPPSA